MSGAILAEIAPVLLLAPLAGSLVDRLPRVQVMVTADRAQVLLAGALTVWHDSAPVATLHGNRVVRADPSGWTLVSALDPGIMATVTGRAELGPIADDARSCLRAALDRMARQSEPTAGDGERL